MLQFFMSLAYRDKRLFSWVGSQDRRFLDDGQEHQQNGEHQVKHVKDGVVQNLVGQLGPSSSRVAVELVIQLSFPHIESRFLSKTNCEILVVHIKMLGRLLFYFELGSSLVVLVVHVGIPRTCVWGA